MINTHLHTDHIGWNTRLVDGAWVPTFPNATYLMPKADFEYWNPDNNPGIAGGINENAFEDSITPVLAAGRVQLWETAARSTPTCALRRPLATPPAPPSSR